MNCLHCGKPTIHLAKYCQHDPECQDAKRKAKNQRSYEYDQRVGRRRQLSDRFCEHCQVQFKGRRHQRFCLSSPECKEAQQQDHKIAVREAHKKQEKQDAYKRGRKLCSGWGHYHKCSKWVFLEWGDDPRFKRWCSRCREWATKREMETYFLGNFTSPVKLSEMPLVSLYPGSYKMARRTA